MSKGTVLVTGGAGYIGSHACLELMDQGYQPIVVDNLSTGFRKLVRDLPLHVVDLRDESALEAVFLATPVRGILHFAASAYVGVSMEKPLEYFDNNVGGTLSLLKVANKFGVRDFVFSSTCATYGIPEKTPITEDMPQRPVNPYGRSKLMVETVLKDLVQLNGWKVSLLRYFNAGGADPKGRSGECHDPETHLIPLAIEAAHKGKTMHLFGDDYPTPDGTCLRDYIHVNDLAEAHVLALEILMASAPGTLHALNLGGGVAYSNMEVLRCVEEVTGKKLTIKKGPRRPGDPPALVANINRAEATLRWKPKRSSLQQIVVDADRWWRSENP